MGRLPPQSQATARISGLALAMLTRIALLFSVVWLTRLVQPWLQIGGHSFSGRDVILLVGGLFLLGKSVLEIHQALEGPATDVTRTRLHRGLLAAVSYTHLTLPTTERV